MLARDLDTGVMREPSEQLLYLLKGGRIEETVEHFGKVVTAEEFARLQEENLLVNQTNP